MTAILEVPPGPLGGHKLQKLSHNYRTYISLLNPGIIECAYTEYLIALQIKKNELIHETLTISVLYT